MAMIHEITQLGLSTPGMESKKVHFLYVLFYFLTKENKLHFFFPAQAVKNNPGASASGPAVHPSHATVTDI